MAQPPNQAWKHELGVVDELMRQVSLQSEPQEMVRLYGAGVRRILPSDRWISLSRRGLEEPALRVTRFSGWAADHNPWTSRETLPILRGGLLSELLYANEPRIVTEHTTDPTDPGAEYLQGMTALMTMPQYDRGVAQNMTILMWVDPARVPYERYPSMVWQANLFGRATLNEVLRKELAGAYEALDREMLAVGEMQRALLPKTLPDIPGLNLAAFYQPSRRAGGDFYDVFALPGGRWGLCIGDVSGHGTPAAVMMAVTHAIAHTLPGPPMAAGQLIAAINRKLTEHYTSDGSFVTAFYGVYDPGTRTFEYASAGHNPPRVARGGSVLSLDQAGGLPMGIDPDHAYDLAVAQLEPGDRLLLYTDGVTEARSPAGDLWGDDRLDALLRASPHEPRGFVDALVRELHAHCADRPADDDRTLLAAWVK